jgi:hypothetical protein
MRQIGNKTHGDLAEIAIVEFINQYMYDYSAVHVGKNLYRAKSKEEDISVKSDLTSEKFSLSLKAYGKGPLQLSTDKKFELFPLLEKYGDEIVDKNKINEIITSKAFKHLSEINILPLIYDEKERKCNILVFDINKALSSIKKIVKEGKTGHRKHPVYKFYDDNNCYIFEVRYGGKAANALQRGVWTNSKTAEKYFISLTNGWIEYKDNKNLIELFSKALVTTAESHKKALEPIKDNIIILKKKANDEAKDS